LQGYGSSRFALELQLRLARPSMLDGVVQGLLGDTVECLLGLQRQTLGLLA
jgi:hypothetical protein